MKIFFSFNLNKVTSTFIAASDVHSLKGKNIINSDNLSQEVSTTNPLKLATLFLLAKKPSNASRNNTKNNSKVLAKKRCFWRVKYTKIEENKDNQDTLFGEIFKFPKGARILSMFL
jgi:hypothetical protein